MKKSPWWRSTKITLLHPESPGTKVTIKRSWFGRLFYSKEFATLGEVFREMKEREREKDNGTDIGIEK